MIARIITNVEKLNEAIVTLNVALLDVTQKNMETEHVAQMWKNYNENVKFHLEGMARQWFEEGGGVLLMDENLGTGNLEDPI